MKFNCIFLPKRGWNFDIVMYSWMKSSCTWVNFWAVFCVKPRIHKGYVDVCICPSNQVSNLCILGIRPVLTCINGSFCKLELVRAKTMLVLTEQMQFVCRWLLTGETVIPVCFDSCCAYCSGEICVSHCCICYSNGIYPYRL